MEHVDHVPYPTRRLFDFGREIDAGHSNNLKRSPVSVKQTIPGPDQTRIT